MPALEIKNKIGKRIWDEYFKFCIVRNPYDKLISQFFYRGYPRRHELFYRLIRFIKSKKFMSKLERDDPIQSFRMWVETDGPKIDRDKYLIDEKICVDYFIKYENLLEGIQVVCKKLNLPFKPESLLALKKGMRKNNYSIKDFYDDKTLNKVKKMYAFEIEKFNYRLPE